MRHLILALLLLLAACAPAGMPADAQATAMSMAVQLTLFAQEEGIRPTETLQLVSTPTGTPTSNTITVAETVTSPPILAPTHTSPAQISEPTETPYVIPGWPLFRKGDTGPEVYAIQHLLRSHGYDLAADGLFGTETRQQVLNFQLANGLSTDGIVGPQTWTALIQGKTVKVGSQGQAVRAVQRLLRDRLGYNEVAVDGDFGPITDNVIVALQNAYDLVPDGIVGPLTWRALVAASPLAQ
jgi:peptidoglycan hydrolase-like protein with peptidoglycan-binding domain